MTRNAPGPGAETPRLEGAPAAFHHGLEEGPKTAFSGVWIAASSNATKLQRVPEVLAIDSKFKLRAWDLVKLRVSDICHGDLVSPRAIVMRQKTQRPV